jgi:hypothetical protein
MFVILSTVYINIHKILVRNNNINWFNLICLNIKKFFVWFPEEDKEFWKIHSMGCWMATSFTFFICLSNTLIFISILKLI